MWKTIIRWKSILQVRRFTRYSPHFQVGLFCYATREKEIIEAFGAICNGMVEKSMSKPSLGPIEGGATELIRCWICNRSPWWYCDWGYVHSFLIRTATYLMFVRDEEDRVERGKETQHFRSLSPCKLMIGIFSLSVNSVGGGWSETGKKDDLNE